MSLRLNEEPVPGSPPTPAPTPEPPPPARMLAGTKDACETCGAVSVAATVYCPACGMPRQGKGRR
jgi:hypothetical protein